MDRARAHFPYRKLMKRYPAFLAQWGVEGQFDAYKNSSTAKPAPYVDPFNGTNSVLAGSPILSTVSPKWNDAGSTDQKLEQIITQKWLAIFPESQEAWTEFRRTGYPKLFPVVINNSGGVIPAGQFIRRINFALSEKRPTKVAIRVPCKSWVAQIISLPAYGGISLKDAGSRAMVRVLTNHSLNKPTSIQKCEYFKCYT